MPEAKLKIADAPEVVLVPNSVYAKLLGVSTRTLFTWEAEGILPPAKKIRKRKYWDPNVRPKTDAAAA